MKVFLNRPIREVGIKMMEDADLNLLVPSGKNEFSETEKRHYLKYCDALINVGMDPINKDFFDKYPNIKAVSQFSVGYNNVDVTEATKRKIPIGNTPGVLSKATSDVSFLLMQFVARYGSFYYDKVKSGDWHGFDMDDHLGIELYGKTLGIFGLGRIGYEMAKKCKAAFEMDIIYHNRHRNPEVEAELGAEYVSFDELIKKSDVLSLHANYTADDFEIFNAEVFEKMKPGAIFINTARGGFHSEKDLYQALREKKIWGAGLDVTNPEPMSRDNPLLKLPNVCVFPHIGSNTVEARDGMSRYVAENMIAFSKGEPMPHCVNPEVYS